MKTVLLLATCPCIFLIGYSLTDSSAASAGVRMLEQKLEELEGVQLNDREQDRRIVFQGDILLTKTEARKIIDDVDAESGDSVRFKRQAQNREPTDKNLWVDGVKYVLDRKSSEKLQHGFLMAAKVWKENTGINFERIDMSDVLEDVTEKCKYNFGQCGKNETDYLFVTDDDGGDGCLSHVGRLGGYQPLILGRGCESFAHTAHEVGQALELYHSQSRHDRDDYIKVNWRNISEGLKDEYVKLTQEQNNNYAMPYDYGSVMHYGSSIREPSMTPIDANYKTTMGSPMISFIDLSMTNEHYRCKAVCKQESSAVCKSGGFPHPRDCDKCICPGGYGGPLCDELPKDCEQGSELVASKEWNTLEAYVYNYKNDGSYATCTYWIKICEKSPSGKLEVQIESIINSHPTIGCAKAGVEIKTNTDHTLTGYRYCVEPDIILKSSSNLVPVILYTNEFTWTMVELTYRSDLCMDQRKSTRNCTEQGQLIGDIDSAVTALILHGFLQRFHVVVQPIVYFLRLRLNQF
ncbi:hypothetical protein Aduo_006733 [Ancylostoma duodenale]